MLALDSQHWRCLDFRRFVDVDNIVCADVCKLLF